MSHRVIVDSVADRDIENHLAWLCEHVGAGYALRVLDGFEAVFERIESNPCMYPKCEFPDSCGLKRAYRGAITGNYKVFYTVDDEKQEVVICRILHMSSDYTHALS